MGTHSTDDMEHKRRALQRSRHRLHHLRHLQPFYQMRLLLQQFHYLPHYTAVRIDSITPTMCVSHLTTGWFFFGRSKVYAMSVAGPIPDELWNLTYLFDLNLAQNLLTGSLSPSIGNLTRMQYLSVGINALSGEIPPQLGLLTELLSLSFSTNNFNGSLPTELGNLSKLQQLYIDSSGVSGEIPSTFSKLKNLHTVWASDNNLIGSIPEFIGDWSQLTQLFLQGNSFEGSIPSTFSNLSALTDLRISDVSNVSSSLEFIRNMKNLSILVLRNNNISDSLPSDFSGYHSLSQLDLSFNKLTGQIPDSLFNLSSLTYLFLGNNSLNGTLPGQKSASLLNIDVSYNNLMGSFPSWVSNDLQLNLVGNNFTLDNSNSSLLPSRLNCLQRNFPCNRGKGIYFIPSVSNNPPTRKKDHTGLIVGVATGVGVVGMVAVLLVFYVVRRRKMARMIEDQEFLGLDARPYTFSYVELKAATDDFNPNNKLGEGGFGPVFKGTLDDGRVIAVKQLSVSSHQGKNQFVTEIATISAVQHRNLVKLYGCCIDAENRLLVYEYLENKSLDQAMFGQRSLSLDWATRYDICLGTARGLAYLHEESRLRIVHRDVKASNILLDSDLTPKISDFGLAKLYDDKKTHISTRVAGTIGYLAPEYAMRGHLTEKADVFAFGVVALEVVSGSSLTETADKSTDKSPFNSPFTASTVGAANLSPEIATTPMLDETIGEGR
ncbi:hypothetical protein NL676_028485 [Syzygium grande]|nr:hypothetical protein NL676_028485 [Syzygium grande]